MKGIVAGLAGLVWAAGAMADGNNLLRDCQSAIQFMNTQVDKSEYGHGRCVGLVQGVVDITILRNPQLPRESQTCFPQGGIEYGQAVRVVVKYLENTPELLHLDDSLLAMIALNEAYRCPK